MTRQTIDELILQRLVDGELSHRERAEFLKQVEDSPESWRDVALALIEEQALKQDLSQLLERTADTVRIPKLQTGLDTYTDLPAPVTVGAGSVPAISKSGISRNGFTFSMPHFPPAALAASLALMMLGFLGGAYLRGRTFPSPNASEPLIGANSIPIEAGKLQWGDDLQPSEMPIYQVAELDPNSVMGVHPREVERLRQEFMRRGLQLNVETGFFEERLPDGRQLVVPIRNVNLRSMGQ